MLVAITGANGFIGRTLVRRFETDGWTVRPIVRRDFESGNLDRLVAGADAVVHAAGATRAPTRSRLVESNVELTQRVIDAARRGAARRLVFISSQAAAGPAPAIDQPVSEDMMPSPVEDYGRTKLEAEGLVRAAKDLPSVIVRPGAVYGPYDRDFLAMFRLAMRGMAIHPANREQWISIAHTDDVAAGVVLACTRPEAVGLTFFVANDEPVQWRDLFAVAASSAGRRIRADVEVPAWLVRGGAFVGDVVSRVTGRASLLTSGKAALTAPRFWICSSERIRRALGYTAATPLSDGLADTFRWYRAQGWL